MNLTHYHVIENTPDYLPDSMDNPAIFENISDATVYAHELVNELIDQCYECSGDSNSGYYCELDADDLGRNIEIIECSEQDCVNWLNEQ